MSSEWDPQKRDEELRTITNVTRAVAVTAVGATVVLGVGIAWGDQQRVDQADNRQTTDVPAPGSTVQPPANKPTPTPAATKAPTSTSGGS